MPDRRQRTGYRDAQVSPAISRALAAEAAHLTTDDPVETIRKVNDFFAGLDGELEQIAVVRLTAIARLRAAGWTYERIADATGLSKPRVAQLAREANMGGRVAASPPSQGAR